MARLAVLANKDNLCAEDEALAKVYVGRIDEALGDQNTIGVQDSKIVELAGAANGLVTALASLGSAGIVGVSVGVMALANNLFSAQAQARRLNDELANLTGENNQIRKEDFQKYQALTNLERQGELSPENLAIAKSALEELQKTYGDLGITIEGNRVVGASAGFEGFKGKVRESYQADIQKQRDALQKQIAATEKEVSNDEYMSMNADNAPAKRTAVWVQRKLGISSDWNDVKELKEQEAALAQQQKDADIFFGTALGGSKQEVYEQLAIGAGGGMDASAIQSVKAVSKALKILMWRILPIQSLKPVPLPPKKTLKRQKRETVFLKILGMMAERETASKQTPQPLLSSDCIYNKYPKSWLSPRLSRKE